MKKDSVERKYFTSLMHTIAKVRLVMQLMEVYNPNWLKSTCDERTNLYKTIHTCCREMTTTMNGIFDHSCGKNFQHSPSVGVDIQPHVNVNSLQSAVHIPKNCRLRISNSTMY